MKAYDVLFDRVLTRTDAETAHHAAFRAIKLARPALAPYGGQILRTSLTHEAEEEINKALAGAH